MKASQLVSILNKAIATYGDYDVKVRNLAGDLAPLEGVYYCTGILTLRVNVYTLEDSDLIDLRNWELISTSPSQKEMS